LDRLVDYGLVLLVILVIMGLFRVARKLLEFWLDRLAARKRQVTSDGALFSGMLFLLAGLLFLPFVTALISFVKSDFLPGGMVLHLFLVAVSVVVFSISEDLFRIFRGFPVDPARGRWSTGEHMRRITLPLLVFWALGSIFLSPLFYSGLTVLLALFYLYATGMCRDGSGDGTSG
jgi:uncharacterized membrane protein